MHTQIILGNVHAALNKSSINEESQDDCEAEDHHQDCRMDAGKNLCSVLQQGYRRLWLGDSRPQQR